MDVNIEKIQANTLIRTSSRSPHHIHMNLYQGCFHQCIYCNGISDNYHMHDDFGETIKAKINAPELFEKYLIKEGYCPFNRNGTTTLDNFISDQNKIVNSSKRPDFILSLFGNVCDVYQPAEKQLQLTRTLLQIASNYRVPVRLLTKSDLVLRDLDLLKELHKIAFVRVAFTITLFNENDQRNFEPNASSTYSRLKALALLRKEGIPAGAYITPIIPFIGDSDENLENIFSFLHQIDSEFVITGGLTLKPGRNKELFLKMVKEKYPTIYQKMNNLYSNDNPYGQPDPIYANKLNLIKPVQKGYELARKYRLNFFEPRYIPNVKFVKNLEIATLLARIGFLKAEIQCENLSQANEFRHAASWLEFLDSDISSFTDIEYKQLKFSPSVVSTIREILETGVSSFLVHNHDFGEILYSRI